MALSAAMRWRNHHPAARDAGDWRADPDHPMTVRLGSDKMPTASAAVVVATRSCR